MNPQNPYARKPIQFPEGVQGAMGHTLQLLLTASNQRRERWYKAGFEVHQYGYAENHNFQYQSIPDDAFFRAKEPLTAEAVRVFGPYLYQKNPHRTVECDSDDPTIIASSEALGKYQNAALGEYDAFANARRCIDQSIVWGRAMRWTTRHPTKPQIICSLYRSVRDFYDDPEAMVPEERRIIIERRVRPVDDVIREHPDYADKIRQSQRTQSQNKPGDTIEYFEAHALVGLQHFRDGESIAQGQNAETGQAFDGPALYLFLRDGTLLCSSEWEFPAYADGGWPCSILDYFDHEGDINPESPLAAGLGYQRCDNWLTTLMMGRMRRSMRMLLAINKTAGEGLGSEEESQVLIGSDVEALMLNVTGQRDLNDFLQEFNPNMDWLSRGMEYQGMIRERYRQITGVYSILFTGAGETQSRSAKDTQLRERNSLSRLDDMKDRIVAWEDESARKEAQAARFLLETPDIEAVIGKKDAAAWGFLAAPEAKKQFAQQLLQMGAPPDVAMAMAEQKFQGAIDWNRWIFETDYSIEADSIRRRDTAQQIASYETAMNQFVPTQIQSADLSEKALGYQTAAAFFKINGADPSLVRSYEALAKAFLTTAQNPQPDMGMPPGMPPAPVPGAPPLPPPA